MPRPRVPAALNTQCFHVAYAASTDDGVGADV